MVCRDYKRIEGLDNYETEGLDSREYRAIGRGARDRAETEMRKRDREKMSKDQRIPAALRDDLGEHPQRDLKCARALDYSADS